MSVRPGAQLSTVLTATTVSTRSAVATTAFELEIERERAEAVTDHAEALAHRAEAIPEGHEDATEAREAGELSAEAFARHLAELNARAEHLLAEIEVLRAHADDVSALELRAAGLNRTALRAAVADFDPLTGVGPAAPLQRFLGESTGEVELRTADGLRVEVEGEDGETSLEVNRPRDGDPDFAVTQDDALETARSALPDGNWKLPSVAGPLARRHGPRANVR